jgi:hypothetical protein
VSIHGSDAVRVPERGEGGILLSCCRAAVCLTQRGLACLISRPGFPLPGETEGRDPPRRRRD